MPVFAYALIAMGVVTALSGAFGWYEKEKRASAEAKMEASEAKVTACEARIGQQNEAVKNVAADGVRRVAAAAKGIAAAAEQTKEQLSEARRLRVLAESALPEPTSCPAAAAVAQIRKGLR